MKRRILLLIKGLALGGAEQLMLNAAPYFDTTRFEYEAAYLLPNANALAHRLEEAGVPVQCLDGAAGAGWVWRLGRLVREHQIDLVHIHSPLVAIGARPWLRRAGGPSLVYTEHSVWGAYRRPTYWGNMLTFPLNDWVFAVSEHVRLSIRYPSVFSHLRMPTTETLYSGIDPAAPAGWMSRNGVRDELGLSEDTLVLGSVANFTVHKAHVYLIHAMARVLRVFPEARLVLVGSGPLEGNVRRKVRDLKLDNTVIFTGSRPDAARLASGFDVFVLSSIQEGLSIALLEAMALGKPAVVTGVGGLKEVLQDGKQGFLVPPADSRALAGALITLLTDDALRTQFGEAARVRANQFDVRLAVRRTEQVYEELLS